MSVAKKKINLILLGDPAGEHLFRWAKYFTKQGHSVYIITWNKTIVNENFPFQLYIVRKLCSDSNLISRMINFFYLYFQIKKLVNQIKPDLIHAHSVGSYSWTAYMLRFHPFIISPWWEKILIEFDDKRLDRYLTLKALRAADIIHSDGQKLNSELLKAGVSEEKIVFLTYGVDVIKFSIGEKKLDLLKKYNLKNGKIILSTRKLTLIHDVDTLIKAIPAVLREDPEAQFLIVGDGNEAENLKALARNLEIEKSVIFVGRVNEEEMVSFLQTADIYVSTSLYECGIAASTAEAMACGLPIINTDTGDIRLWLKNGQEKYITKPGDPDMLSAKLIFLISNEEERKKYRRINRTIIEERNNYHIEMKKMEDVYLSLCS